MLKKLHPHDRILSKTKINKVHNKIILTLLTKNYIHNMLNISLCSISFYSMKLFLWSYMWHVHHNASHSFWVVGFQVFLCVPPFYIICILLNMVYLFLDPVMHPFTKLRQYIVLPFVLKNIFTDKHFLTSCFIFPTAEYSLIWSTMIYFNDSLF